MTLPAIDMPGVIEGLDASDRNDPLIEIRLENGWLVSVSEFHLDTLRDWPLLADVRVQIEVFKKPGVAK